MDEKMKTGESAPQTRWGLVFFLVGAGVVGAFQVGKAPPALPVMRPELHLSLFAASWILSIFNVIGAVTGIIIGAVADWAGHRRLILSGICFMALGSLLGALSPNAQILLASRFIEGVGFFFAVAAVPTLIVRTVHPDQLRMALGIWSGYIPAGMALMMVLAPFLIKAFGWRGLWISNTVILVIFGILLALVTKELGRGVSSKIGGIKEPLLHIKKTLSTPGPIALATCFITYTLQWMAVMGFLPTFFVEELGLTQGRAAALTAVIVAVNFLGNLSGGWLLQKNMPRWSLVATGIIVMSLSTLGIYSGAIPDILRFILCLMFSGISGVIPAAILSGAPVHAPEPHLVGTTNGLILQGSNTGHLIGPPILALIVGGSGGWQGAPWLFMISGFVGLMLALVIRRIESPDKSIERKE